MKRATPKFWYIMLLLVTGSFQGLQSQSHEIRVILPDLPDASLILAHRFGSRFFIDDTVQTDQQGVAVFKGERTLEQGMYQVVLPDKKYIEFFLSDRQHLGIRSMRNSLSDSLRFENSPENELFYRWQRSMRAGNSDPVAWQDSLMPLGEHIVAKFIRGLMPPRLPEELLNLQEGNETRNIQYQYYRHHFFSNVDFGDGRLLLTPLINNKLEQYFSQVALPDPDSVIADCKRILSAENMDPKVYQFVLQYLLNHYSEPKIMGMDAVYVFLAENYYLNGKAPWISEENLVSIRYRVKELKPTLLGSQAPPISGLFNPEGEPVEWNALRSEFLLLYFWEPDCGHCKESTPMLRAIYDKLRTIGVEVLAVNTRNDTLSWDGFIDKENLNWINVYVPGNIIQMLEDYQAWSTPKIFILNRSRKIIAKDIVVDQVLPFMENHLLKFGNGGN